MKRSCLKETQKIMKTISLPGIFNRGSWDFWNKKIFFTASYIITAFIILCCADSVFAACNVSTTSVNFVNYDVFSASPLDANGSSTVICDRRVTVTIAIGPSPNSGGFNPRMMKRTAGSDLLNYNLYIDANRTQIWGNGSSNTYTKMGVARRNIPWINTVYGRIPPGQDVSAGFYNETLTVTITW